MHRRLQFGMRENPASERRHGSRASVPGDSSEAAAKHSSTDQGNLVTFDASQVVSADMERFATGGGEEDGSTPTTMAGSIKAPPDKARKPTSEDRQFEPLLDVSEAARLLRIHPKTLRVKAGHGIIPGIQIGRVWRFRASMLNRWLESVAARNQR